MNLKINKCGEVNLLLVEGTVDENNLREITDALVELPSSEEKYILLDCANARKLIYSGIGFSGFVNHLLHLRSMRATITLIGSDNMVHRLLKLLKIESMFHYAPTMDQAYLDLQQALKTVPASNTAA